VKALWAMAIAGLAAGACLLLITLLASRDSSQVDDGGNGPGVLEDDRGARRVTDGPPTPVSEPSRPPTSGPHRAEPVERDRTELSDDQILEALQLGNIVIAYEGKAPDGIAEKLGAPFEPELAAAGQSVILAARPGIGEPQALAWRHRLALESWEDPQLQAFVDAFLGQGPA